MEPETTITPSQCVSLPSQSYWAAQVRPILSDVGSVASLVGVLFTAYAIYQLYQVKNQHLNRVRLPQILPKMNTTVTNLTKYLSGWPDHSDNMLIELSTLEGTLRNLKPKVSGELRNQIVSILEKVQQALPTIHNMGPDSDKVKADVRVILSSICTLRTQVSHNIADDKADSSVRG